MVIDKQKLDYYTTENLPEKADFLCPFSERVLKMFFAICTLRVIYFTICTLKSMI